MSGTLNVIILQAEESRKPSLCDLDVLQIPALGLDNGTAHFQCEGKKVHFFIIIMYIQIVFQVHGYTGSFPGTRLYRQFSGYSVIQVVFRVHGYTLYRQFSWYTIMHVVFRVHGYTCSFPGRSYRLFFRVLGYTVSFSVLDSSPGTRSYSQFLMG